MAHTKTRRGAYTQQPHCVRSLASARRGRRSQSGCFQRMLNKQTAAHRQRLRATGRLLAQPRTRRRSRLARAAPAAASPPGRPWQRPPRIPRQRPSGNLHLSMPTRPSAAGARQNPTASRWACPGASQRNCSARSRQSACAPQRPRGPGWQASWRRGSPCRVLPRLLQAHSCEQSRMECAQHFCVSLRTAARGHPGNRLCWPTALDVCLRQRQLFRGRGNSSEGRQQAIVNKQFDPPAFILIDVWPGERDL